MSTRRDNLRRQVETIDARIAVIEARRAAIPAEFAKTGNRELLGEVESLRVELDLIRFERADIYRDLVVADDDHRLKTTGLKRVKALRTAEIDGYRRVEAGETVEVDTSFSNTNFIPA